VSVETETQAIRDRYSKRRDEVDPRYDPLKPWMYLMQQERDRAWIRWISHAGLAPLREKRLLEVGCGVGDNLVRALGLGFEAEHLTGIELMPERIESARARLPAATQLKQADALTAELPAGHFDVVLQAMVFSSILDEDFRRRLATRMWEWVKPGGGVLSYDFTYDNPSNPDVTGISQRQVRELFPQGQLTSWRVTLAPPLARWFTRIHPAAYGLLNAVPLLRTHLLIWIRKES
jgi:SAM-dependent methyltransferase